MTGHQASRPATQVYLHFNLAREPRSPDQNSSPRPSVRAVPPLRTFLSTSNYAEQQTT